MSSRLETSSRALDRRRRTAKQAMYARQSARVIPTYVLLIALVLFVIIPFIWMLITSLKPEDQVLTAVPQWIPHPIQPRNYVDAWNYSPFGRYYLNSFIISATETLFDLTFGAMAAYAFARIDFYGKRLLFLILLSTLMVPGEMMLIPNFLTISHFHWANTYQGLIVPWLVSVFTIFLMRQFFLGLPTELFESAELDGATPLLTLFRIIFPVSKPIWITAGLIKFIGSWNSFLWVIIVANSQNLHTLPVGILNFAGDQSTQYNQLMAASTFSLLPLVVLFVIGQRYFIQGIARSGLR